MSQVVGRAQRDPNPVKWPARESPHQIKCICGHKIYDGEVIRARVINPHEGKAKCKCKRWVKVPIALKS